MRAADVRAALARHANPRLARFLSRFFKTGAGEYGHGDIFLGLKVPTTRAVIRPFVNLPIKEVERVLRSKLHEERLAALLILVHQFRRGDEARQRACFDLYMANRRWINNWDLVDCRSSPSTPSRCRERLCATRLRGSRRKSAGAGWTTGGPRSGLPRRSPRYFSDRTLTEERG